MHPTPGALYARVSSEQHAEAQTIASHVAAWRARLTVDGLTVAEAMPCLDDGSRGAPLVRPALERLRAVLAAGRVDRLSIAAPARLARQYASPVLRVEECRRAGVAVIFLHRALGHSPEDALLLQGQGRIAASERATMSARHRRGTRPAAPVGAVHVLRGAPSGYRSVTPDEGGGQARSEIVPDEARVVPQVLTWGGRDRLTLGEGCRRRTHASAVPRTGKPSWERSVGGGLVNKPASQGAAAFGKTRQEPLRPRRRAQRKRPRQPRRAVSTRDVPPAAWSTLPGPALVAPEVCAAVQPPRQEHKRPARQAHRGAVSRLHGLLPWQHCGSAF